MDATQTPATTDNSDLALARLSAANHWLRDEVRRLTLTDAERYAVAAGVRSLEQQLWSDPENLGGEYRDLERYAATLRGLLERLK